MKAGLSEESNSVGRPTKYKDEYAEQAYKLCLLGSTDVQLADFFQVVISTIYEWKLNFPEFSDALRRGKTVADAEIASSLYNRALGCTVVIQQAIKLKESQFNSEGKKISEEEKIEVVDLEQESPPDTSAAIFWLKNRAPKVWRDKPIDALDGSTTIDQINLQIKQLELEKLRKEVRPEAIRAPDEDYKIPLPVDEEMPDEPIL